MENWKYPMPSPSERNANANHGTKTDSMKPAGQRGTMGHKSSGYGTGGSHRK